MTLRHSIDVLLVLCASIASTACFADFIPQKIATGGYHTCVLSTDGAIKCWGSNFFGQLGTGDNLYRGNEPGTMGQNLKVIDLGLDGDDKTVDICAGDLFTCASTQKGGVKCWGENSIGQLGQGRQVDQNRTMGKALPFSDLGKNFKTEALACGFSHVCVLSDQGFVKCWGGNEHGALGLGDNVNRGRNPNDMGDALPILAGLKNITSISSGYNHSCALSAEGARCWGEGKTGKLGLESAESRGARPESIPGKSPFVQLFAGPNEKIVDLRAGFDNECALMTLKTAFEAIHPFIKCWGNNRYGTLGTGNMTPYGLKPGTMGGALPRLNLALDDIVSLNTHAGFTCALSKLGHVKCWGANGVGQLGLGENQTRGGTPAGMGMNLPAVDLGLPAKHLSTGSSSTHSCAILINNEIKCWGEGGNGQLGYEDSANRGTMPSEMGDALPFVRFK